MSIIAKGLTYLIPVLGVAAGIYLIWLYAELKMHYAQITAAMNWNSTKAVLNRKTMALEEKTEKENVTPETIHGYEKDFNETCSKHEMMLQLIPVFPLMGILGTVAGLSAMVSNGVLDRSAMMSGLGSALMTTFFGLICAIILKCIDAALVSRVVYNTDILLQDYDKKLDDAIKQKHVTE